MKITKISIVILALLATSCAKTDPVTGEKIIIEPDPAKKAREFADKGGGIFGNVNKSGSGGTTYEFATSNILWRATLKSLDFIPLTNADYSGGVIITDWYSDKNSKEQIKIQIKFLSNEVKSSSLEVKSFKRLCEINGQCTNMIIGENFNTEIRDSIMNTARIMKIEEQKSKK